MDPSGQGACGNHDSNRHVVGGAFVPMGGAEVEISLFAPKEAQKMGEMGTFCKNPLEVRTQPCHKLLIDIDRNYRFLRGELESDHGLYHRLGSAVETRNQ